MSKFYYSALKEIGPQVIQYLIAELLDSPNDIYFEFYSIIKSFNPDTYELLADRLSYDGDPYYIEQILTIWTLLKEKNAFMEVRKYFTHSSTEIVRIACLYYLQFGKPGMDIIRSAIFDDFDDEIKEQIEKLKILN